MRYVDTIFEKIGDSWSFVAGRPAMRRANMALLRLALRGSGVLNYRDVDASGEANLWRRLGPMLGDRAVVWDVGANVGRYISVARQYIKQGVFVAFEPNPECARILRGKQLADVRVEETALASAEGATVLYIPENDNLSEFSSLLCSAEATVARRLSLPVATTTIDKYISESSTAYVDFIKIDVEGSEVDVLHGAYNSIKTGRIGLVQVEFNTFHYAGGVTIADYRALLPNHVLYRVLRAGLLRLDGLEPYAENIFGFQNILAVPQSLSGRDDLAQAIEGLAGNSGT